MSQRPVAGSARLATLLLLSGLLAACSGNDVDRLLGRNDSDGGSAGSTRSERGNAVAACMDEVRNRGWRVLESDRAEASGQNNMEVEMRVRQGDGDERDVTCTYDAGRGSVVSLDG